VIVKAISKGYAPRPERREIFTIILLIAEVVIFSLVSKNFLTAQNLSTVLRNATDLAIIAIGMTMVMIMGGIDISVGSSLGVVAIIVGWMIQAQMNPLLIVLAAVSVGTVIGVINGALITYTKIPDIITTLGTSNILRAAVFAMLGGRWLTGLPPVFSWLTSGNFLGIPTSFFLLLVFYLAFWYFLTFRPTGRHIYAIGNGLEATNLAGVNVNRTRLTAYGLLGALVGFAALLYVGRLGSVEITVGMDLPMQAIAAAVIGGTSVKGGAGSVVGTLAGVLFMAVMRNGIVLLGIPSLWERCVIGLLILISVGVDLFISQRAKRRHQIQLAQQRQAELSAASH
jgi:ribose transport system permease protein